jgi:exopolyphosphatase/guanosine-5'-triphosphate,3'-diphosphate pyrophosphatase
MDRAVAAVSDFCARARGLGAERILVVGTSAVRDAANRSTFLEQLRQTTAEDVRVVPGEEEGRLTLLGVLHGLPMLSGAILVVDIGGGSTEFTLARDRELVCTRSLALGVVPLAERYMSRGPVDWARYATMDGEIRAQLARDLKDFGADLRPDHLVGTAGTVSTLAALDQALPEYDSGKVHGYRLRRPRVQYLLSTLGALAAEARAALPCLEPGRADLIVPGSAICLAAMDTFGHGSMIVSECGLREGILIDYLARAGR